MFKNEVHKVWEDPKELTCPYSKYGCKNQALFDNNWINEEICPFRTMSCPTCCWSGPANSFGEHIMENYNYNREYITLVLDGNSARVIKRNKEFYVLWYTCDESSGEVQFGLRFVGPLQHSQRRIYRFLVKERYGEAEFRKQVSNYISSSKDPFYTVEINLHDLKIQPTSKDVIELEVCVIVEDRIPTFSGSIQECLLALMICSMCGRLRKGRIFQQGVAGSSDLCQDCNTTDVSQMRNFAIEEITSSFIEMKHVIDENMLLKALECQSCSEYMVPPIKNCVSGHNICGSCRSLLSSCPICNNPFSGIRNFSLETIYSKMQFKCINSRFGCTYINFANMLHLHENCCPL